MTSSVTRSPDHFETYAAMRDANSVVCSGLNAPSTNLTVRTKGRGMSAVATAKMPLRVNGELELGETSLKKTPSSAAFLISDREGVVIGLKRPRSAFFGGGGKGTPTSLLVPVQEVHLVLGLRVCGPYVRRKEPAVVARGGNRFEAP